MVFNVISIPSLVIFLTARTLAHNLKLYIKWATPYCGNIFNLVDTLN